MKLIIPWILVFTNILIFSCAQPQHEYKASSGETYLGISVQDIEKEVHILLDAWYPILIDTVNGGYWTNLSYNWQIMDRQDKMLVTQARGLWTASRAAGMFPQNPVYRKAADHGFKFLTQQMWDEKNRGFYQYYFINTQSGDTSQVKTTYANAFVLYAFSEYAKINNSHEVLEWMKTIFYWLEEAAHDSKLKGYYNTVLPKGADSKKQNYLMGDPSLKDQNTSIHLMEAFTAAYEIWSDELLKERLREILELVRDTMVNEKGSLDLFFSQDWKPVDHSNESRDFILESIYTDHVSFGHDIETAYLLLDASKALYGRADSLTIKVAKKLIDHSLDKGFDKDYYGIFDKGYYFKNKEDIEIIDSHKVWWAQGEAWHSLALINQYFPGEKRYSEAFVKMWKYINEQIIDQEHHGWYNSGLDSDPGNVKDPKAHQWKSCYHDGRALMMVYQYAKKKYE